MRERRLGLGRASAIVGMTVAVTVLVILGLQGFGGATAGRHAETRIRELEAMQTHLYEMVAAAEARIEAQRKIYVGRIRKVEGALREKERELVRLRSRLRAVAEGPAAPATRE